MHVEVDKKPVPRREDCTAPPDQASAAATSTAAAKPPLERAASTKQRQLTPWVRTGINRLGPTGTHARHASKSPTASYPAKSPASVMLGQQVGQQNFYNAEAVPFKPQRLTRPEHVPIDNPDPDPEFPPGFNPTVRVHSTQEFPGLATGSNKTHPSTPNLSNSTSAAGQLSFSLAAAKRTQTPSPPTLSKVPILPPGLIVASQADATAPLSVHTLTEGSESPGQEPISNGAPAAADRLSNSNSQQSGSSNEQPKQQGWDHQSGQLHKLPEQSGWDIDSNSEPGAAWTVGGNKQCSWDTHSQQDNDAFSIPRSGWQPDKFQSTAAKGTGFFTPIVSQKPQQRQRMHSIHQYSPDPLARSPFDHSRYETEHDQKTTVRVGGWNPDILQGHKPPYRIGGWNPDRYQGTGAAAFSDADTSIEEKQWQYPSASQDDSLHSLLSFAFPQAPSRLNTSETRRPASAHALAEQQDPDLNDSLSRMHIQRPTSSSASGRQKSESDVNYANDPCAGVPLPNQKASQMHSQQHQSWDDSSTSQSRPEISPAFPGGFGLRPSHLARSSEGTCAQSPTQRCHYSASGKDLVHSSRTQHATNGSSSDESSGHDGQDRYHSLSRQHSQDTGQLEGGVPMGGDSKGDDAEGLDPRGDDAQEAVPAVNDAQEACAEGGDPGYTTQITQDYTSDLLQYLRQEPKKQEWATAGPKRDKSRSANAQKPLALFDRYCIEGKLLRSHIDERCLSYMSSLHPGIQCQALTEFANHRSKESLSNSSAYFMILLKGLQSRAHTPVLEKTQAPRVLAVPRAKPAAATTISPEAEQKLAELYSQAILEPALLDQHCLGLLARLPQNAQLVALTRMAANINGQQAKNKRGHVSQLLKHLLVRAGEFNLKLDPCSIFYDANLAMCWRVLTKQDKWEWQNRIAKGKQIKLANLSHPRQMLAQQLHQGHPQCHAPTAAAWKKADSATKEALLRSADQTGEAIKLLPDEQPKPKATKAPEPEFHETDFPPLSMTTHTQHDPGFSKPMTSGNSSLHGAGVPSQAAGVLGTASTKPMYVPRMPDQQPAPAVSSPQPMPSSRSAPITSAAANQQPQMNSSSVQNVNASHHHLGGELHTTRSGDCHNTRKDAESLCIVCFDVKPLCMCMPCGHIAICKACSQAVKEQTGACPVCQQAIQAVQEVFFA